MIYERVIQWIAGPFSVSIGALAAKLVTNWGFLGSLGLTNSQVAKAITASVVFVTSSGVTYLAHHKWLDNLAKWWTKETGAQVPGFADVPVLDDSQDPPGSAVKPDLVQVGGSEGAPTATPPAQP